MTQDKDSLLKRYKSTAKRYDEKGRRDWAYAKNDLGGEHYAKARDAFDRAKRNQDKADQLEKEIKRKKKS